MSLDIREQLGLSVKHTLDYKVLWSLKHVVYTHTAQSPLLTSAVFTASPIQFHSYNCMDTVMAYPLQLEWFTLYTVSTIAIGSTIVNYNLQDDH